ncbi:MAG: hypothetical protein V1775_00470 [Bacteroidota bacterium]
MKNIVLILIFSIILSIYAKSQVDKSYGTHGFYIGNQVSIQSLNNSGYKYEITSGKIPEDESQKLKNNSLTIIIDDTEDIQINIDYDKNINSISHGFKRSNPKTMELIKDDFQLRYGEPSSVTSDKASRLIKWDCERDSEKIEIIIIAFASTFNNKVTQWSIITTYSKCPN